MTVQTCPACGSDAITCEGQIVSSDDSFRLLYELGSCLTCGATLRYRDGQLEEITLLEALEVAVQIVQIEAAKLDARLNRIIS